MPTSDSKPDPEFKDKMLEALDAPSRSFCRFFFDLLFQENCEHCRNFFKMMRFSKRWEYIEQVFDKRKFAEIQRLNLMTDDEFWTLSERMTDYFRTNHEDLW